MPPGVSSTGRLPSHHSRRESSRGTVGSPTSPKTSMPDDDDDYDDHPRRPPFRLSIKTLTAVIVAVNVIAASAINVWWQGHFAGDKQKQLLATAAESHVRTIAMNAEAFLSIQESTSLALAGAVRMGDFSSQLSAVGFEFGGQSMERDGVPNRTEAFLNSAILEQWLRYLEPTSTETTNSPLLYKNSFQIYFPQYRGLAGYALFRPPSFSVKYVGIYSGTLESGTAWTTLSTFDASTNARLTLQEGFGFWFTQAEDYVVANWNVGQNLSRAIADVPTTLWGAVYPHPYSPGEVMLNLHVAAATDDGALAFVITCGFASDMAKGWLLDAAASLSTRNLYDVTFMLVVNGLVFASSEHSNLTYVDMQLPPPPERPLAMVCHRNGLCVRPAEYFADFFGFALRTPRETTPMTQLEFADPDVRRAFHGSDETFTMHMDPRTVLSSARLRLDFLTPTHTTARLILRLRQRTSCGLYGCDGQSTVFALTVVAFQGVLGVVLGWLLAHALLARLTTVVHTLRVLKRSCLRPAAVSVMALAPNSSFREILELEQVVCELLAMLHEVMPFVPDYVQVSLLPRPDARRRIKRGGDCQGGEADGGGSCGESEQCCGDADQLDDYGGILGGSGKASERSVGARSSAARPDAPLTTGAGPAAARGPTQPTHRRSMGGGGAGRSTPFTDRSAGASAVSHWSSDDDVDDLALAAHTGGGSGGAIALQDIGSFALSVTAKIGGRRLAISRLTSPPITSEVSGPIVAGTNPLAQVPRGNTKGGGIVEAATRPSRNSSQENASAATGALGDTTRLAASSSGTNTDFSGATAALSHNFTARCTVLSVVFDLSTGGAYTTARARAVLCTALPIIRRYRGVVEVAQVVGGGLCASFNYARACPMHEESAAACALEIFSALREVAMRTESEGSREQLVNLVSIGLDVSIGQAIVCATNCGAQAVLHLNSATHISRRVAEHALAMRVRIAATARCAELTRCRFIPLDRVEFGADLLLNQFSDRAFAAAGAPSTTLSTAALSLLSAVPRGAAAAAINAASPQAQSASPAGAANAGALRVVVCELLPGMQRDSLSAMSRPWYTEALGEMGRGAYRDAAAQLRSVFNDLCDTSGRQQLMLLRGEEDQLEAVRWRVGQLLRLCTAAIDSALLVGYWRLERLPWRSVFTVERTRARTMLHPSATAAGGVAPDDLSGGCGAGSGGTGGNGIGAAGGSTSSPLWRQSGWRGHGALRLVACFLTRSSGAGFGSGTGGIGPHLSEIDASRSPSSSRDPATTDTLRGVAGRAASSGPQMYPLPPSMPQEEQLHFGSADPVDDMPLLLPAAAAAAAAAAAPASPQNASGGSSGMFEVLPPLMSDPASPSGGTTALRRVSAQRRRDERSGTEADREYGDDDDGGGGGAAGDPGKPEAGSSTADPPLFFAQGEMSSSLGMH